MAAKRKEQVHNGGFADAVGAKLETRFVKTWCDFKFTSESGDIIARPQAITKK